MTVPPPRRAWVEQIMGMPVSVHLRGPAAREPAAEPAVAAVFAELRAVDALFSTYRADSQVNRLARGDLPAADRHPLLDTVIDLCQQARQRTGGYFDADLPGPDGTRFDPSGLVKGWAVERAARHLHRVDGVDFCLNAGGDLTVGGHAGTGPWRVGVEDPHRPTRLLAVVTITAGAVATSGTAHRGTHIVDPHTATPARHLLAVTITGPSLTWADVYATAAVARGPDALAWLAALPGHTALLVDADGDVQTTPGWDAPAA